MGRCLGRVWACAAVLALSFDALLQPAPVHGQEDEVIVDPELSGGSSGSKGSSAPSSAPNGDEVIEDPELSGGQSKPKPATDYGWGDVYEKKEPDAPPPSRAEEPDPMANTGIGHLEMAGQMAIDVHNEGSLEDFYEARLRFGGEVDFRLSRKLRLSLGTRIDFGWYAPHQNDPALKNVPIFVPETAPSVEGQPMAAQPTRDYSALDQDRYVVDIVPLAAYLDGTLAEGVHLRAGAQVISLGRMDGLSVVDMLAVLDMRPQARADVQGIKLAQPAVRLDWDMSTWATLQLVYVPWFMPHVVSANRDRYVGSALTGRPEAGGSFSQQGATPVNQLVDQLIAPSWQTAATEASVRYLGPAPDFRNPQAEARVNFRGSSFEVALLGGTALEKMPAVYYAPIVSDTLLLSRGDPQDVATLLAKGYPILDVEYHRYYMVGFDGSFDIAPVQISFEFGFSPERHLYTQKRAGSDPSCPKPGACELPMPNVNQQITNPELPSVTTDANGNMVAVPGKLSNVTDRSIRVGVPMIQAALHMEYLKGETFAIVGEGYLMQAFERPYDVTRDWLGFGERKGTYLAGLVGASYAIDEGRYRIDASFLGMMGPSFLITPQFEVRVVEGFYLSVGAQIYEGPTPNNVKNGSFIPGRAATNLTLGGVLSGYDNVYLGFRWIP